jgi:hypothetical protein
VFPVLKLNRILDQPQIRFIYNRGTLQGVIDALSLQVVVSYAPKFAVDQRHERVERSLIAFSPSGQQICDLVGRLLRQTLAPLGRVGGQAAEFERRYPGSAAKSMKRLTLA